MGARHPVASVPELFAHALAIEREASERYLEFARRMAEHDNPIVAELFYLLARNELDHAMRLERQTGGMTLPEIDALQYAWLDAGAPETAAHDLLWHFMRPYHALKIALKSEQRAKAFFEEIAAGEVDADIRALAEEMAREEQAHVKWVEEALAHQTAPYPDWDTVGV